jgi:hypothetical protein
MSASREIQICNAIAAELNNPTNGFSSSFAAAKHWLEVYQATDLANLQVSVTPWRLRRERLTRGNGGSSSTNQLDYTIQVDMQKLVNMATLESDCDALSAIAEQVFDFYSDAHYLAGLTNYQVMEVAREDICEANRLYDQPLWESYIEMVVRVYVAT